MNILNEAAQAAGNPSPTMTGFESCAGARNVPDDNIFGERPVTLTKRGEAYCARNDLGRRIEAHLAAAEALIAELDAAEGDPDLEPWLGSGMGGGDDREAEDENDEAGGDDEHTDGWQNWGSQAFLGHGNDELEDVGDAEPSMGWSERDSLGPKAGIDPESGSLRPEETDNEDDGTSCPRPDSETRGHVLAAAMLARVDRRDRPDPDTCYRVAPGVVRLGGGLPVLFHVR